MVRRKIRENNILFLCPDNSCNSQMAEAIAKRLAPPATRVFSAGLNPGKMDPAVAKVMNEVEIDVSNQRPKGLDAVPMDQIDLIIALGEAREKFAPLADQARVEHWTIPDPRRAGGGEEAISAVFRYVRDEIDKKVAALFLDHWRNLSH
ncbi:MAG: arsenate reductase ArsC [Candidatus Binatia bacterium]